MTLLSIDPWDDPLFLTDYDASAGEFIDREGEPVEIDA